MKKLLILIILCLIIISFIYASPINENIKKHSPTIMNFIEDHHKEKCELNKISTKQCPTYSADNCIKGSWFIE